MQKQYSCKRNLSTVRRILMAVFLLAATLPRGASGASMHPLWRSVYKNFAFFPKYHLDVDLYSFALYKNNDYYNRFILENSTTLRLYFLSYRDLVHSVWDVSLINGMGRQEGGILFDPQRIDYGIIPMIELGRLPLIVRFGLDHHCFHQIDRDFFKTIYWNKLLLYGGSYNAMPTHYWSTLVHEENWSLRDRLSWHVAYNFYLRTFFGLVAPGKLNGLNDKTQELHGTLRYALYRRNSWIVAAQSSSTVGYWDNHDHIAQGEMVYHRHTVGLECFFRPGRQGGLFFVNYTLDAMPLYREGGMAYDRLGRDRLLEFGVRIFR